MLRNKIKNKKAAAFEIYNWFLLFFAFVLMIIALFSLFVKLNEIDRNSLGAHADTVYRAIGQKNLQLAVLDENVNIAAVESAFLLAKEGGFTSSNWLMGAPIIKVDAQLTDAQKEVYMHHIKNNFKEKFVENLKQKLVEAKLDFIYDENSIQFVDDEILGYALSKASINSNVDSKVGQGVVTVDFMPNFAYSFQNYSLNDYENVIEFLYNDIINSISECDDERCVLANITEINEIQERYYLDVNKNCIDWFNGNRRDVLNYIDLYKISNDQIVYEENVYFVCIEDKERRMPGKSGRAYDVFHPVYNYAIDIS